MLLVVTTPLSGLLALFAMVPLCILAGIYGTEGTANLIHRRRKSKTP